MTAEGGNQPDIRGQMMDKRNVASHTLTTMQTFLGMKLRRV